jgi:hypothetical protein
MGRAVRFRNFPKKLNHYGMQILSQEFFFSNIKSDEKVKIVFNQKLKFGPIFSPQTRYLKKTVTSQKLRYMMYQATLVNVHIQGWTGHIRKLDFSHVTSQVLETLRQLTPKPPPHLIFFLSAFLRFAGSFLKNSNPSSIFIIYFWGPLKKNHTKIWLANPLLYTANQF